MNHLLNPLPRSKTRTREEFQRLYAEEALPLLKRWNFDVVAHGPSPHDENSYYVIRRFTVSPSVRRWRHLLRQ